MFVRALLSVLILGSIVGCENRNKSVGDSVEDAGRETGQAIERAGDRIKDATN